MVGPCRGLLILAAAALLAPAAAAAQLPALDTSALPSVEAPSLPAAPRVEAPSLPSVGAPSIPRAPAPPPVDTGSAPSAPLPSTGVPSVGSPVTGGGSAGGPAASGSGRSRSPAARSAGPRRGDGGARARRGRAASGPGRGTSGAGSARGGDEGGSSGAGRAGGPLGGLPVAASPLLAASSDSAAGGEPGGRSLRDRLAELGDGLPFPEQIPDWSRPIILALGLLVLALLARALAGALRVRRLEGDRRRLSRDVAVLQDALVPKLPPTLAGQSVSAAYRPASGPGAGGDFYDAFPLAGGALALMVGDVSGHGPAALGRATQARYALRAYLEAGLEPRRALEVAGAVRDRGETGEEFTTVVLAVYDPAARALTYATAGHPPPIVAGAAAGGPVTVASSPPLGFGVPTGLRQTRLAPPPGSLVCLYTDGLAERRAGGRMVGREGVAGLVAGLGPDASADALLDAVAALATDAPTDDMAALILRPRPAGAASAPAAGPAPAGAAAPIAAARVEELVVTAAEVRGSVVARFLSACGVDAGAAAEELRRAEACAGEHGVALMRVRVDARGARVEVTAPDTGMPRIVAPVAGAARPALL